MSQPASPDLPTLTALTTRRFVIMLLGTTPDDADRLIELARRLHEASPIPFLLICPTPEPPRLSERRAQTPGHLGELIQCHPLTPDQARHLNVKALLFLRPAEQSPHWAELPAPLLGHCPGNWPAPLRETFAEVTTEREHDTAAWASLLTLLISEPALRRRLRWRERPADLTALRLDGPFDSSYSLAIVNRELARALQRHGATPLLTDPELAHRPLDDTFRQTEPELASRVTTTPPPAPAVMLRNTYPPLATDMNAGLNLYTQYAWEESAYPADWVDAFNANLHGMTVVSSLVRDLMRNNGLQIPLAICPNGVDHLPLPAAPPPARAPEADFTFLHISSCFARKGIDCLLDAWGRAFSATDPVKLIIKTFANPHNDVDEQLQKHRARPGYPRVELILDDYTPEQMATLYQRADAFVAPSRAEGFGMPMAEAMRYRIPLIVTAHGGHTDFCTPDTAWLVDYRFDYSRSHLGLFSSVWAEPEIDSLVAQLRAVFNADPAEKQRRCQNAFDRVTRHFRWDQIGQRTLAFIRSLPHAPLHIRTPNLLWVSTFNSRCGIATYSENLLCEFPRQRVQILADRHATPIGPEPENLSRCLTWGEAAPGQIMQRVEQDRPDAVVIQHNHAFMSLRQLAELLVQLKRAHVPSFVTLHNTTPPPGDRAAFTHQGFHHATRLLVHSVDDLNRLKQAGLVRNTMLFPHGVYRRPAQPHDRQLKTRLGLEGKRIIASFGFVMPHKGLRELIQAFSQLAAEQPDLHLLLCNAEYPDDNSRRELAACDRLIEALALTDRVTREHRFLADADALQLLSLADLLIYPYQHTQESASGAVRMGITASVPVLATPLPIFKDVAPAVHFLPGTHADAIAQGIREALARLHAQGRDAMIAPAEAWQAQHQWPTLSRRLLGMIKGLLRDRDGTG